MTILDKIKEAKRAIQEKTSQIPDSKTDEDLKNPEEEVFTADKYPALEEIIDRDPKSEAEEEVFTADKYPTLKKTINRAPKSAVEAALNYNLKNKQHF
jgi:hypothetical protein